MWKFIGRNLRLILITLLSLTFTLIWTPQTSAQLPLLTPSTDNQIQETPQWDLNKAYPCGRFWCSQIYTYSGTKLSPQEIYTPEYILAVQQKQTQSTPEVIREIEQRTKLVERTFLNSFDKIIKSQTPSVAPVENNWQYWLPTTDKPQHPWTPRVEVGVQNNQTVIFIPAQPELGLGPITLVTVTDADAKVNATTIEELAKIWQFNILRSYNNVLWGYELDRQHPWWRTGVAMAFLFIALVLIGLLHLIRELFRKQLHRTRRQLDELIHSLSVNPEAVSSQKLNQKIEIEPEENSQNLQDSTPSRAEKLSPLPPKKPFKFFKKLSRRTEKITPKIFRERQSRLRQQRNIFQLCLRLISIGQVLILIIGLGLVALTFRSLRFLYLFFFQELLILPFLWIALIIIDKIFDFIIDYLLNRWAADAQEANPTSNRYTLRVSTYSTTLKRASALFFLVLGIYLTIWILGLDPAVLAGAGVVAVAIAFLSRNFLEDVLNGILILWTDRYAIGDVVDVGDGLAGLVEDMNLYVTSLRNLDGQLIVIPNGKISSVINMSKDWSRVNFCLKIASDADLKKTIEMMQKIDRQLRSEPQWQEKILEPLEILGIDEISHEGILIRALIKTQPKEQWSVDREFRLRLKYALDAEGILLGIPQQQVWHRYHSK